MAGMLRRAAEQAGDAIMELFDEAGFQGQVDLKEDDSPVTDADRVADDIIRAFLIDHFPGIPMVTEETVSTVDRAALAATQHYWLVDGLDGTKAFRKGEPDFTVNIALIDRDQAALGLIYAPAHGEGFVGIPGQLAIKYRDDTPRETDLRVRAVPGTGLTLLTSTTPSHSRFTVEFMDQIKIAKHIRRHSSIKYGDVAAARGDVMIAARDVYFWDSAAGDAIVRAAGGAMMDMTGRPLCYDRTAPNFMNHGVIACGDPDYLVPVIQTLNTSSRVLSSP
jgi:3'(2'), 5'-bisphosphate nucleotidase